MLPSPKKLRSSGWANRLPYSALAVCRSVADIALAHPGEREEQGGYGHLPHAAFAEETSQQRVGEPLAVFGAGRVPICSRHRPGSSRRARRTGRLRTSAPCCLRRRNFAAAGGRTACRIRRWSCARTGATRAGRSEEHTSELQSL